MIISITKDTEVIKSVFTSSNNKWFNFDDSHPYDNYTPILTEPFTYLLIQDDCYKTLGIITLIRQGNIAECHLAFLKPAYGRVFTYMKECLDWIKTNTDLRFLIAPVLVGNTLVIGKIEKLGFKKYMLLDNYWVKDGISYSATFSYLDLRHNN